FGQRSVINETFGGEWRVLQGSGESVEVVTPFHRLALAARHAAFKNEPLKPQDKEKLLTELKDRLMFWVYLEGPSEQFARHFSPLVWTGYVLFIDALVARLTGRSYLTTARSELVLVALVSIAGWWLFEWYNAPRFWRGGGDADGIWWQYHGLEPNLFLRRVGYDWAFATIFPALFLTAAALRATVFARCRVRPWAPSRRCLVATVVIGVVAAALPLIV